MRLLHLHWPHLALRLELRRRSRSADWKEVEPDEPVVLGGLPWEPGSVLDHDAAAGRLGVRRGQPLGTAHKLVPEARFLPAEPDMYRRAFEECLDALSAFTPSIEGQGDPSHEGFGRILLGIEGLDRLWGDERTLLGRVVAASAAHLPGPPRTGIAGTRFGSQVAAGIAGSGRSLPRPWAGPAESGDLRWAAIPPGGAEVEAAHLAPLSIRWLTPDGELQERFRLFGLTRIGEFAALDRSAVVARFGHVGGELHDLARGMDGRPLRPRRPVERLRAEAELEPPVEEIEPLRFVLRNLVGALCAQLAARGAGAGAATLELELEMAESLRFEQPLPEPAAAPDLLERLLLARLEADPPRAPVARLCLELTGAAPAAGRQLGLFTPQSARAARLEWQLTSLAIRFGADRIRQAVLRDPEASLPEERFAWRATISLGEGS